MNRIINCLSIAKKLGTRKWKNSKAFIGYSQATDHVYKNLEDYNPTKKRKVVFVFDDMIAVKLIGSWVL